MKRRRVDPTHWSSSEDETTGFSRAAAAAKAAELPTKPVRDPPPPPPSRNPAKDTHQQWRQYPFGNNPTYYASRLPDLSHPLSDARLDVREGRVLDIGCNTGLFTLALARRFNPRELIALDVDEALVAKARSNLLELQARDVMAAVPLPEGLPVSFAHQAMRLAHSVVAAEARRVGPGRGGVWPYNVRFKQGNAATEELGESELDLVCCFSVTKWIHLHHGDEGVKSLFHKVFSVLRPGGRFLLEPQPYSTYRRRANLSETTRSNYGKIKLMPAEFPVFLKTVGFRDVTVLEKPSHKHKGFERPLYMFTKPG